MREVWLDINGGLLRSGNNVSAARRADDRSDTDLPPGSTEAELEGVFVARQGRAVFVPVTTGIAGERYFEALSGVTEGDLVITGPFSEVRNLDDGDRVRIDTDTARGGADGESSGSGFRLRFGR